MTTKEFAEHFKMSVRQVQAKIKTGQIRAQKPGHDWIIPEDEIARWQKVKFPKSEQLRLKET